MTKHVEQDSLRAFGGLHVLRYAEGVAIRSGRPRGVAGIVAQRGDDA